MIKPIRIQRSRKHKQVSPNGLPIVYVGRPSKYGNTFRIKAGWDRERCVNAYEQMLYAFKHSEIEKIKSELKGKNLSCWCNLNVKCHADILLKLVNEK